MTVETHPIHRLWQSVPVILRAVIAGALVASAGTLPWSFLVSANLKHLSSLPWAVPVTALYLWLFWRYMRGSWWPSSTSEFRRMSCRANNLSSDVWGASIIAGILGLIAIILFQQIMSRLVVLPRQEQPDVTQFSILTVASWLIMSGIVAGVAEETAFRGYMQGPIEHRHGPVIAIVTTGILFGFAHFTHPEVSLILMPYYVAVAAVYGGLAYLTNSIYPGLALHAGGNILGSFDLFTRGRSEWQAPAAPSPLIWQSGMDAGFVILVGAFLVTGGAAIWAYRNLAKVVRIENSAADS
jgi:membrane protease YdiL (CAAX protease family)